MKRAIPITTFFLNKPKTDLLTLGQKNRSEKSERGNFGDSRHSAYGLHHIRKMFGLPNEEGVSHETS